MLVRHGNGLVYHSKNYYYISDNDFEYEGYWYEKDCINGRCYRLEESNDLRPHMDGALVKRRIKKESYETLLKSLKDMLVNIPDGIMEV